MKRVRLAPKHVPGCGDSGLTEGGGQPLCSLVPGWPAVVFTGAWLASRCRVHWLPGWPAVVVFTGFLAGQPLCSLGAWLASRCRVHWLPGWPAVVFTGCRCRVHWLASWLLSVTQSTLSGSEHVAAC